MDYLSFMSSDDYLQKCAQAGLSLEQIGKRLGLTAAEVGKRLQTLRQAQAQGPSSLEHLQEQLNVLACQYQLLGESLMLINAALSKPITREQIQVMLPGVDSEKLDQFLREMVVLRAFRFVDPAQSMLQRATQN